MFSYKTVQRALLVLLFFGLFTALASAADPNAEPDQAALEKSRQALGKIVSRLRQERKALKRAQGKERSLLGQVGKLDRQLVRLATKRQMLQGRIEQVEKDVPALKTAMQAGQVRLAQERKRLAAHMRLMYGLGGNAPLKIALSGQAGGGYGQGVHYFSYLIRARNEQFERFRQQVAEQLHRVTEYAELLDQLRGLEQEQSKNALSIERDRANRLNFLKRIRREEKLRSRKVKELDQARRELTSFVENMDREISKVLVTGLTFGHITAQRGRLISPVLGRAEVKRPGLFYPMKNSRPVRAVFRGQVAYADWFRGFGQLLMLNHGDHIYTLYGHNAQLLVVEGDWVEQGEAIAEVGDTGSMRGMGLYFEIRRGDQPENPKRWLARAGS